MDPIFPWLDPAEVRRLADRLMNQHHTPTELAVDAAFDDDFIGFTPDSTPSPAAALREKFTQLSHWLHSHCDPTNLFILGPDDAVIFEKNSSPHLHLLATRITRNVRLKTSSSTFLELIPSDGFTLGATVAHPLTPASILEIQSQLATACTA